MLADFTGSDWCPGCIHLRKNIFDTDAFAKYAADHQFVLLELDFPKAAGKMPPEQLKFHEELMRRYGVSSFPSVLLMEGNGAPYAKIVGATRTPEEYLKKLEAAGETRRKLKEAVAAAQPLKGKEKLEQLVKALNVLPEDLQPFQKELIAEISALDPEDRYGFGKKSEKSRSHGEAAAYVGTVLPKIFGEELRRRNARRPGGSIADVGEKGYASSHPPEDRQIYQ